MELKSIQITGFKSFAKKISLDLSQNVTGVVGPNGSGKSNVSEAIKFVLGEQSMKGMRSKTGADLIFKGSSFLSPLNRASVSLILNNTEKKISANFSQRNEDLNNLLKNLENLDEVILTREIYKDGQSEYLINGTKVRLKDVQEILALANISTAGHTMVNQGEADRILLSNNQDRKEMIEDALGLRIYHIRIKESEKKMDKVSNHLKEIEIVRRENLPHLNSLKKQMKDLEKREEEIINLSHTLKIFLYKENLDLEKRKNDLKNFKNLEENILNLEKELENFQQKKQDLENFENKNSKDKNHLQIDLEKKLEEVEEKIKILKKSEEEFYKKNIEVLEKEISLLYLEKNWISKKTETNKQIPNDFLISKNTLENFEIERKNDYTKIFLSLENKDLENLKKEIEKLNLNEKDFFQKIKNLEALEDFQEKLTKIEEDLNILKNKLDLENQNLGNLKNKNLLERQDLEKELEKLLAEKNSFKNKEQESFYKIDNEILKIKLNLEKFYSEKSIFKNKQEILLEKENHFENLILEMNTLIGSKTTLLYKSFLENEMTDFEKDLFVLNNLDLEKKIERSKIKIEESGIMNVENLKKEYQDLLDKENFFNKEITDLENSKKDLENLIQELKETLLLNFNEGLNKINENFNNYFNEIFPGGKAGLSLLQIEKKIDEEDENSKIEYETGIDISISLPEKKVKDLQMLSGGERALSSIALIFAMSSINHPPFMVLDETDAALDEANARKYGKMIKRLAENSKLLVITHNRETMNQCNVLYGVTVGGEGCSKLLSIKFEDATQYAK